MDLYRQPLGDIEVNLSYAGKVGEDNFSCRAKRGHIMLYDVHKKLYNSTELS